MFLRSLELLARAIAKARLRDTSHVTSRQGEDLRPVVSAPTSQHGSEEL